jgi:hypothetical protein
MPYIRPFFALFGLTLTVILLYASKKYLAYIFKQIKPREIMVLSLIVLAGIYLRFFLMRPHHVMYVDEFWYMKAAKDLILYGQAAWYPKSIGWPVFLVFIFSLFGISNLAAIYTNTVLGLLTPLNIFLIAFQISKNKKIAMLAAGFFSLISAHIIWSVTAESNVFSLYFLTLCIVICLLYYEHKTLLLFWTSLAAIGFAAQCRPENYILYPLFLTGILLFIRPLPKLRAGFITGWLASIALSLPNIMVVLKDKMSTNWLIQESGGTISGGNFNLQNLLHNSRHWGIHLFDNSIHSFVFSALFVLGVLYCLKHLRKYTYFLLSWFSLLYLLYFSSWFQTLGGSMTLIPKLRFYVSFYPIMVIFVSVSIDKLSLIIKNRPFKVIVQILLVAIIIARFTSPLRTARQPLKELQTKVISELEDFVCPGDTVLTALGPVVSATNDIRTYPLEKFLKYASARQGVFYLSRKVLFFQDYTCTLPSFEKACREIKSRHKTSLYHSFDSADYGIFGKKPYSLKLLQIHKR